MEELRIHKELQQETMDVAVMLPVSHKTEVYLVFSRLEPDAELTASSLREILDEAGVVYGVNTNSLKNIVEKNASGELQEGAEEFLVASGKPVKHGENGRVDFLIDPSPENVFFDVDSSEDIDYKNTNLIQNVIEEQHLATIIQPTEPENGVDVFGQNIDAKVGELIKVKLGQNVVQDGDRIYSAVAGRFIQEGDTLSVNPVYIVRDDVGYRVGNINFVGAVQIQKDILDDFSVIAKGNIEVNQMVGAATVEGDQDIIINGGINGKGKGFLRSLGRIEAKYANEATLVSHSDIQIQKSIIQCTVKTKGKVDCPHSNLVGGEASALMGIDIGTIGSDLGVKTTVIAGRDYELQDKIKAFEAQLLETGKEIEKIDRVIGPILADKNKLMALPVEKKRKVKDLLEQLKHFREEQARARKESEELEKQASSNCVKEIIVRKTIHSGAHIVIGNCKKLIKMDVKGPVRLREDIENDTISITSVSL
jgi:uncharacterized protein